MQFIDLCAQYTVLKEEIDNAIQTVLREGQFILGKQVDKFENELKQYLGVKHVITCANGTDALQLCYMAYGIGKGDAVFCPAVTFIASIEPAAMLGATTVFCDVKPGYYNLCTQSLERQIKSVLHEGKLTPKAVVAVDFLGNPADYDVIANICEQYNLILIEDAAQGFGGVYKGKKCGTFGNAATTSFFPAKPLGCYGDGGAIMTNDDNIADLCRSLRFHGKGNNKYDNVRVGMNSRLDTIQAAILSVKLKAFAQYEMERRQIIAQRYNNAFKEHFELINIEGDCLSPYAQYSLLADNTSDRNDIITKLNESGIPSMIYYPTPLHRQAVFANVQLYDEQCAVSEDFCARTFSVPMHPYLAQDEQDRVINAIEG